MSWKKTQQDKLRQAMSGDVAPDLRKDKNLANVVINERRNRKAARYLVDKAPHQFKDAYVCIYMYIYTHVCVCVCVCVHIHTYMNRYLVETYIYE